MIPVERLIWSQSDLSMIPVERLIWSQIKARLYDRIDRSKKPNMNPINHVRNFDPVREQVLIQVWGLVSARVRRPIWNQVKEDLDA